MDRETASEHIRLQVRTCDPKTIHRGILPERCVPLIILQVLWAQANDMRDAVGTLTGCDLPGVVYVADI